MITISEEEFHLGIALVFILSLFIGMIMGLYIVDIFKRRKGK